MNKNLQVLEGIDTEFWNKVRDDDGNVLWCKETDFKKCCNCPDFRVERDIPELQRECIFKDKNRTGIIPNLIEDFKSFITELKRIKIKFFMLLKGKNHD